MSAPRIEAPGAPRPRRPARAAVLDLDGTCLDAEQRLHPRTRSAVRAAVGRGAVVILATGRMYRSALPWAGELGVRAPLVCYGGAVVEELPGDGDAERDGVRRGPVLLEDPLDASTALRALRVARTGDWHLQAYQDDRLLCEQDRPEAHLYARIAQVPITYVDDLEARLAWGTTKLLCVVDEAQEADRCESALRAALGSSALVARSLPPFIEVTSPRASKGRALEWLCGRLGVSLDEDVVAVGDASNDADMLRLAGFAVAVEGGSDALLALADARCAPPQEGGVADVLEALGLT